MSSKNISSSEKYESVKKEVKNHKDLEAWKKSIELVCNIYKITDSFPKNECYGLALQMRRAAISIPSNIAEGAARNSKKEFIQFLYFALGSSAELETQIIISGRLNYSDRLDGLMEDLKFIQKMIYGLIYFLKK